VTLQELFYGTIGIILLWLYFHPRSFLLVLLIVACLILATLLGPAGGTLILVLLLLGILVNRKWRLI
jgi:hypothetical protein